MKKMINIYHKGANNARNRYYVQLKLKTNLEVIKFAKKCKKCGHTKSCHKGVNKVCLHLKTPFSIPTKKNICGCKKFIPS